MDDDEARAMLAQATPSIREMVVESMVEGHEFADLHVILRPAPTVHTDAVEIAVCSRKRVLEDKARGTLPAKMGSGFVRMIVEPVRDDHLRVLIGDGAGHWRACDITLSLTPPGSMLS